MINGPVCIICKKNVTSEELKDCDMEETAGVYCGGCLKELINKRLRKFKKEWPIPTVEKPSDEVLKSWFMDSMCQATDGCQVEHDGICPHGHRSWFLYLGIM